MLEVTRLKTVSVGIIKESLKQLYVSLVRPHLKYACQVWDPHLVKDKDACSRKGAEICLQAGYLEVGQQLRRAT
jgi:hypothetical protein